MRNTAIERTAYHEAGHAAVAWRLGFPPFVVSIVPEGDTLGHVRHRSPLRKVALDIDSSPRAIDRAERQIMILWAGGIAERRFAPRSRWRQGCDEDHYLAREIFSHICGADGKAQSLYSRLLWRRAELWVSFLWPQIENVAKRLLAERRLSKNKVLEELRRL